MTAPIQRFSSGNTLESVAEPALALITQPLEHRDKFSLACTSKTLLQKMQLHLEASRLFARIYCHGDVPPDLVSKYSVPHEILKIPEFIHSIDENDREMVRSIRFGGVIHGISFAKLAHVFPHLTSIRFDNGNLSEGLLLGIREDQKLQKINLFFFPLKLLPPQFPLHKLTGTRITVKHGGDLRRKLDAAAALGCKIESLAVKSWELRKISKYPEGLKDLELLCYHVTFIVHLPNTLKYLDIRCSPIPSLPLLPDGLTFLGLERCHKIKKISHLPSSLRSLKIDSARELTAIAHFPESLKSVILYDMPKLVQLPKTFPKGLTRFHASCCPKLKPIRDTHDRSDSNSS